MEITFASSESTSFLKDPTILIAAGALIISIITLYYTFFRKAKILSFKPKAIILKTNENQLLAEIRNVYLLNSTANKTTAIMDIWLVLSGRSSSIKIDFQKEKMIQVGIEKYPSVPSQALWSNSALIHLEPLIP
ncbi:hypothetical protein KKA08_09250, partial [bacterium]|nr:hypothetical protein [bacterium]